MGKFANINKMIKLANENFNFLKKYQINRLRVNYTDTNNVATEFGHEFINMCSCSYLGLDRNQSIVEAASKAILEQKTLLLPTSRMRVSLNLLDRTEKSLSDLFDCKAKIALSCSAASSGLLPLIASGFLTKEQKPIMIFDKNAHFSMNHLKSSCGDETEVLNCLHNDLDFIEDVCKRNTKRKVAYIADGAYSMGGYAPVEELELLQERYGLFIYYDDSHSVSVYGNQGAGYVRSKLKNFNENTIIVGSLGKGFGVCGAVIMLAKDCSYNDYVDIYGGPLAWSQTLNVAGLGGVLASAEIHKSPQLKLLQNKLRNNIKLFDEIFPTEDSGSPLTIRVLELHSPEQAIMISKKLYDYGFYTSAVFFPIVAKDRAGIRVMLRADMEEKDIMRFADIFKAESCTLRYGVEL